MQLCEKHIHFERDKKRIEKKMKIWASNWQENGSYNNALRTRSNAVIKIYFGNRVWHMSTVCMRLKAYAQHSCFSALSFMSTALLELAIYLGLEPFFQLQHI